MKTLVLGYGNRSRNDDGAGWFVIDQLREMALPGVELMAAHQLEVDLIETVSRFDLVIFVDAALPEVAPRMTRTVVEPALQGHAVSHYLTPADTLAMARVLYGSEPHGLLFQIPAYDLNFGEKLSPQTDMAAREVVRQIADLAMNPGEWERLCGATFSDERLTCDQIRCGQ
jgi:hydrogenase maturation protease